MRRVTKTTAKAAKSKAPLAPPAPAPVYTVAHHFDDRPAELRAIYDAILDASSSFGRVKIEPKKTSIHLVYRSAFAGVSVRKDALILTLKSAVGIKSPRVYRAEQVSAHRWHLEIRLNDPGQVDRELKDWLRRAFELSRA